MTENFGENLVDLGRVRLSADAGSELGLNHVEGRLHIRPLMRGGFWASWGFMGKARAASSEQRSSEQRGLPF